MNTELLKLTCIPPPNQPFRQINGVAFLPKSNCVQGSLLFSTINEKGTDSTYVWYLAHNLEAGKQFVNIFWSKS